MNIREFIREWWWITGPVSTFAVVSHKEAVEAMKLGDPVRQYLGREQPLMPALITIVVFVIVYIAFVRSRIRAYRYIAGVQDRIDSGAVKGFAWLWEKLRGFKTVILASLAGIIPTVPPLLDELSRFTGWAAFVEQATANRIAAGFALIAMITHATGIDSAARAEPKK